MIRCIADKHNELFLHACLCSESGIMVSTVTSRKLSVLFANSFLIEHFLCYGCNQILSWLTFKIHRSPETFSTKSNSSGGIRVVPIIDAEPEQRQSNSVIPSLPILRIQIRKYCIHSGTSTSSWRYWSYSQLPSSRNDRQRNLEERTCTSVLGTLAHRQGILQNTRTRSSDHYPLGSRRISEERVREVLPRLPRKLSLMNTNLTL